MKCKPHLIDGKLHTRQGVWLCIDDQSDGIHFAPMVAVYA